jgi:riboflavin synthase
MFTGIVEEIGTIRSIQPGSKSVRIAIEADVVLEGTKLGDSIATNGVCLTVTQLDTRCFWADVMPETLKRSGLGELRTGSPVNLERALRWDGRLGGHLVSGHIDGTGRLVAMDRDDNAVWYTISADEALLRYVVEKGSITLDGVSLTVAEVGCSHFRVSLIPHTRQITALGSKRIGDCLNIEVDIIAKYVEKLFGPRTENSGLSLEYLQANGF